MNLTNLPIWEKGGLQKLRCYIQSVWAKASTPEVPSSQKKELKVSSSLLAAVAKRSIVQGSIHAWMWAKTLGFSWKLSPKFSLERVSAALLSCVLTH